MTTEIERRLDIVERNLDLHMQDAAGAMKQLQDDVACIKRGIEKYEPFLKEQIDSRRRVDGLRRAIIEKSLVAAVWAVIVFIGLAGWEFLKRHVRD